MISFFLGGDFRYFYPENIVNFITFPLAWDSSLNTGIGHSQVGSLWIMTYFNLTLLLNKFGINWDLISLLCWILPSIVLSFSSSFFLFNYLFKDKRNYPSLSGIIYSFNTYFLMILTGGQLGVALSYSIVPLVLLMFIKTIKTGSLKSSLITGLVLGLQIIFDPRIVYITLLSVFIYSLLNFYELISVKKKYFFLIPFLLSAFLNAFWILPILIFKSSPIPQGFDSLSGLKFFSFADFSHALALLHPNWPENIFGKTYFLQPEFLILPVLAYSSLLFISKINSAKTEQKSKIILFFALIGLLGTFLAKGLNPPFGEVNKWLFQHFPGMLMFRDPTKWYILVAISYSVLIPYSIDQITIWINSKLKIQNAKLRFKIINLIILMFVVFLIFLTSPIWTGELKEKLKPREVPKEYVELKDFLYNQPQFFRTLWIPQWQRLGYFSNLHPAIGRFELLKQISAVGQIKELQKSDTQFLLQELSVKYLIVPYDSERELFLKNRKFDEKQYQNAINQLDSISWLRRIDGFEKIAVFETQGVKDHFWSPSKNLKIKYDFVNTTQYKVSLLNAKKGDLLVFSESFDRYWLLNGCEKIYSKPYKFFNSFALPKSGNYSISVYYSPQKWVNRGLIISIITLSFITMFITLPKLKQIK